MASGWKQSHSQCAFRQRQVCLAISFVTMEKDLFDKQVKHHYLYCGAACVLEAIQKLLKCLP